MHIIKPIQVKQVITDTSKRTLKNKFEKNKVQLERECEQLLFEKRKLTNKLMQHQEKIKEQFQQQIDERKKQITLLNFKLEQLDVLPIGAKLIEREVEGLIKVNPGDNWEDLMREETIVVKDNIVIHTGDE